MCSEVATVNIHSSLTSKLVCCPPEVAESSGLCSLRASFTASLSLFHPTEQISSWHQLIILEDVLRFHSGRSGKLSHRSRLSRSFLSLMCCRRIFPLCSTVRMRGLRPLPPPWLSQNSLSEYKERRRRLSRHPDWRTDTAFSGNLREKQH